jgi:hypothetical protein
MPPRAPGGSEGGLALGLLSFLRETLFHDKGDVRPFVVLIRLELL